MSNKNRRQFIKRAAAIPFATGASGCVTKTITPTEVAIRAQNDRVNVAAIGMGIMGFSNCRTAVQIPGVNLVAVCDLYTGRLERSKEVFGQHLFVTQDYKEIISRADIDAVIISTSDHWHDVITIAALQAGKHVYCEKPMVHHIHEGQAVVDAELASAKVLQIGSQRVSSALYAEAAKQYKSGILGDLILVEAAFDRQSALGAWQYSIPTDASLETIDWDRFIGDASRTAFDPVRFFRWRNYQDYGTGVSGDMLVHFFSGFHAIINSLGPERIYATGGLRYWNDGRDVPDIVTALVDYPQSENHAAFNAQIRVNFVDGKGGGSYIRLVGTEGVLDIKGSSLTVSQSRLGEAPGYGGWDSYDTFSSAEQARFKTAYEETFAQARPTTKNSKAVRYELEKDYNTNYQHHAHFYNAIRTGTKIVEDGAFGLRAAAPALAANKSFFEKKIVHWDPIKMELVG